MRNVFELSLKPRCYLNQIELNGLDVIQQTFESNGFVVNRKIFPGHLGCAVQFFINLDKKYSVLITKRPVADGFLYEVDLRGKKRQDYIDFTNVIIAAKNYAAAFKAAEIVRFSDFKNT